MRYDDPFKIDLTDAVRIAHASSGGDGRPRWSELNVYHLPDGRFLAEALGHSSVAGEKTKRRVLASRRLDRALELFDVSDLGTIAKETAREWEEQREAAEDAASWCPTDREALVHLYGEEPKGRKGYSGLVAQDFGASESTVRSAIANNTAIKVPLAAVMPFLDRELLARVRELRDGR